MVNPIPSILLSATLLLSGCIKNQDLKSTANVASNNDQDAWGFLPPVRSVSFIGADEAWLVTEREGELWRTEDGGKDWNKLSGKLVGGRFAVANFIDSQHGWAVNDEGQIWRTGD